MFKLSIKTNILTIFLFLVGLVAFSLLISQYYFNYNLAIKSTDKTFKLITSNISTQITKNSNDIHNILNTNINNINLSQDIEYSYNHPALEDLTLIVKLNKNIYSIFFTDKHNSFYQLLNPDEYPQLSKLYKAPKNTKWIVSIIKNNKALYTFLDDNNIPISKYYIAKEYNPLSRPWYISAINSTHSITTKPYEFASLKISGMTFATKLKEDKSVLGIDYTMKEINQMLSIQKYEEDSEIFIFNKNGDKFASSNSSASKKVDSSLMELMLNSSHDDNYFATYLPLKTKNTFLGIKVNSDSLFRPYIENTYYSMLIGLLVFLVSIPIILFATNIIVKPIKALTLQNQKIKDRKFGEVVDIKTNIIEFIDLSNSLVSMSHSIQEYQKAQEELLGSIVKLIAQAVDAKSPYTGGHCERVPEIAQMLISELNNSDDAIFKDFKLESEDEKREFEIGAWLHDCGKVTTPEYVVDKSTKLETINDRIHEVRTRFEVLWRDAQINYMSSLLASENKEKALSTLHVDQDKLIDDFNFIASVNIGGEFMDEAKQKRVKEIANIEWERNFDDSLGLGEIEIQRYEHSSSKDLPAKEKLLADKKQHIIKRENFDYTSYERDGFKEIVPEYLYNYGEVYNLCIEKGTLTPEERYKINEHVIMSIKMLEKIPFPSHMTKVPEYAGTHHETLIGNGYPRQLTKKELSIPARVMAVADIFEALTASDRPYKKAKTLSESIKIMGFMVKDQHIDEDIFKLFLKSGIYKIYAKNHLKDIQIDKVDIEKYL